MFIQNVSDLAVTRVVSAHRLLNSPIGVNTFRKHRERWAVALKLGGKTIYTVNGEQVLSDGLHPVILPKGCDYSWKCVESGECMIIEFDAAQEAREIFSFEILDNSFLTTAFQKIEKSLYVSTSACQLECKHLLYGILYSLAKLNTKEYIPNDKRKILQPAVKYIIETYYSSDITNDLLAQYCGISTIYFRKIFEQVYGVSPIKYLHELRINKAKAILSSDYESIGQVAGSVGYNSIYHFSKMFRQHTGMSPTEYAKTSRY